MGKTLYIQIDNNSLPAGCGEDIEVLDCRCINDFCSFAGDALVGDLKDENGKLLYRLINPIGKLLMDFKAMDEKSFDSIIEEWYDILGNLLHKGIQEDDIEIKFPQQYVDWLLHSDDPYYEQIGIDLQKKKGMITLSSKAIDDNIIASLNYRVSHMLEQKKEAYSFVVFSNPIICNNSFIVKRIKLEGLEFLCYDRWMEHIVIRKREEEEKAQQKTFTVNGVSFDMIRVEGGTFTMRATSEQDYDAHVDEKPAHQVTLNTFYIAKYEVTQELWQAIMGSNPSCFKGILRPVEQVSWDECQEFIHKLNKLMGQCFRLPTEAEWEYAARGGMKSKGYKYAGSKKVERVAWFGDNSDSMTHSVGQKQPNELGIYDMSGNVWEWCQDKYNVRVNNISIGFGFPLILRTQDRYSRYDCIVCRGGSWNNNSGGCRVSYQSFNEPDTRSSRLGLRLALTPPPKEHSSNFNHITDSSNSNNLMSSSSSYESSYSEEVPFYANEPYTG